MSCGQKAAADAAEEREERERAPRIPYLPLSVGDKVKFNHPNGSIGTVTRILGEDRYEVRWVYGLDSKGELIAATSHWVRRDNLLLSSDVEYDAMAQRRFNEASEPKPAKSQAVVSAQSVLQPWVESLTFMQQSVLIAATRGPDGIRKDHIAKVILRWYRRCVFYCAFHHTVHRTADEPCGGSFTGPLKMPSYEFSHGTPPPTVEDVLKRVQDDYMRTLDELPHHFQLHLMHAAEIIGYKHPTPGTAYWWRNFYRRLVNDMHLVEEEPEDMERRLGDNEANWRAREEVTAR